MRGVQTPQPFSSQTIIPQKLLKLSFQCLILSRTIDILPLSSYAPSSCFQYTISRPTQPSQNPNPYRPHKTPPPAPQQKHIQPHPMSTLIIAPSYNQPPRDTSTPTSFPSPLLSLPSQPIKPIPLLCSHYIHPTRKSKRKFPPPPDLPLLKKRKELRDGRR